MAKSRALKQTRGWIEVICGPMFAGKSDELIRTLHKWKYADIEYLIFKPKKDSRSFKTVNSRNGLVDNAIEIDYAIEILEVLVNQKKNINVIAIDEAQFFDDDLVDVVEILAKKDFVVIVAGLDCDFRSEPFGPIPKLLAKADAINKLTAICTECGALATRTQRLINNQPADYNQQQILVGNSEAYTARCIHCHSVPNNPNLKKYEDLIKKIKNINN